MSRENDLEHRQTVLILYLEPSDQILHNQGGICEMEGILAIIVGWVVVAAIISLFKNGGKNKDRDKNGNLFTGDYADKIIQDTAKKNSMGVKKQKEQSKNNGKWVYVVIAVVAAFLIFGLIGNFISKKQQENSVKQEVNDVNYCRSVAAQYGQQWTNEFSNAYNACMTGKGW